MRNIITFLIFSLTVMLQIAICQEPKAPTPDVTTTAVTAPKDLPTPEKAARDPFWPIGYWPQKNDGSGKVIGSTPGKQTPVTGSTTPAVVVPKEIVIRWPDLKVKGLTKQSDGTYIAILDGVGIVEAGQIVQVHRDGFIFKFKISEINQKGILQQKLDYKPEKR